MPREPEIGFFKDPVKKKSELRRSVELLFKMFMTMLWVVFAYTFTWYFSHNSGLSIKGESFESVVFTLMIIGFATISALPLMHSGTQDKILYISAAGLLMVFSTAVSLNMINYSPEKIVRELDFRVTGIRRETGYRLEGDMRTAKTILKERAH